MKLKSRTATNFPSLVFLEIELSSKVFVILLRTRHRLKDGKRRHFVDIIKKWLTVRDNSTNQIAVF